MSRCFSGDWSQGYTSLPTPWCSPKMAWPATMVWGDACTVILPITTSWKRAPHFPPSFKYFYLRYLKCFASPPLLVLYHVYVRSESLNFTWSLYLPRTWWGGRPKACLYFHAEQSGLLKHSGDSEMPHTRCHTALTAGLLLAQASECSANITWMNAWRKGWMLPGRHLMASIWGDIKHWITLPEGLTPGKSATFACVLCLPLSACIQKALRDRGGPQRLCWSRLKTLWQPWGNKHSLIFTHGTAGKGTQFPEGNCPFKAAARCWDTVGSGYDYHQAMMLLDRFVLWRPADGSQQPDIYHQLPPSIFTFPDCSRDLGTLRSFHFNWREGNKDNTHLGVHVWITSFRETGLEEEKPEVLRSDKPFTNVQR